MIQKVFFDTNVILDVILDRQPFSKEAKFVDFEDGLQYFSATAIKEIEAIITRDKKGFIISQIPVFTPGEFVTHLRI